LTIEDNSSNILTEVTFHPRGSCGILMPKTDVFEVEIATRWRGRMGRANMKKLADAHVQEPAITLALFLFRWYNKFNVNHLIYKAKGAKNHVRGPHNQKR
jgi:hypothetical protein